MDEERVKDIKMKLAAQSHREVARFHRTDIEFLLAKLDQAGKLDEAISRVRASGHPVAPIIIAAQVEFRDPTPPEAKL